MTKNQPQSIGKTTPFVEGYSKCLQSLESLQLSGSLSDDFAALVIKLDNLRLRFLAWGEATLSESDRHVHSTPKGNKRILETLALIRTILDDGEKLEKVYGLIPEGIGRPASKCDTALVTIFDGTRRQRSH